jgi:hypothetical protein
MKNRKREICTSGSVRDEAGPTPSSTRRLGSAAAWPLVARAQQPTMPVVGVLSSSVANSYAFLMAAFMQVLKEAGFNDGQNLVVEQRWANNRYDRLPEMAADLVRARVSLILAIGNNLPARAVKAATSTIPNRFRHRRKPRSTWPRCQFQPPWRKHHRRYHSYRRYLAKALAVAPRLRSKRQTFGISSTQTIGVAIFRTWKIPYAGGAVPLKSHLPGPRLISMRRLQNLPNGMSRR